MKFLFYSTTKSKAINQVIRRHNLPATLEDTEWSEFGYRVLHIRGDLFTFQNIMRLFADLRIWVTVHNLTLHFDEKNSRYYLGGDMRDTLSWVADTPSKEEARLYNNFKDCKKTISRELHDYVAV